MEDIEITDQISFSYHEIDYKLSERQAVKILVPLFKERFGKESNFNFYF